MQGHDPNSDAIVCSPISDRTQSFLNHCGLGARSEHFKLFKIRGLPCNPLIFKVCFVNKLMLRTIMLTTAPPNYEAHIDNCTYMTDYVNSYVYYTLDNKRMNRHITIPIRSKKIKASTRWKRSSFCL